MFIVTSYVEAAEAGVAWLIARSTQTITILFRISFGRIVFHHCPHLEGSPLRTSGVDDKTAKSPTLKVGTNLTKFPGSTSRLGDTCECQHDNRDSENSIQPHWNYPLFILGSSTDHFNRISDSGGETLSGPEEGGATYLTRRHKSSKLDVALRRRKYHVVA